MQIKHLLHAVSHCSWKFQKLVGYNRWTGLLDWTAGLDCWTGLLDLPQLP